MRCTKKLPLPSGPQEGDPQQNALRSCHGYAGVPVHVVEPAMAAEGSKLAS